MIHFFLMIDCNNLKLNLSKIEKHQSTNYKQIDFYEEDFFPESVWY